MPGFIKNASYDDYYLNGYPDDTRTKAIQAAMDLRIITKMSLNQAFTCIKLGR